MKQGLKKYRIFQYIQLYSHQGCSVSGVCPRNIQHRLHDLFFHDSENRYQKLFTQSSRDNQLKFRISQPSVTSRPRHLASSRASYIYLIYLFKPNKLLFLLFRTQWSLYRLYQPLPRWAAQCRSTWKSRWWHSQLQWLRSW